MDIRLTQGAEEESAGIPPSEQRAMQAAFEKLEQFGDLLPFPHSSKIVERNWRELRPRLDAAAGVRSIEGSPR